MLYHQPLIIQQISKSTAETKRISMSFSTQYTWKTFPPCKHFYCPCITPWHPQNHYNRFKRRSCCVIQCGNIPTLNLVIMQISSFPTHMLVNPVNHNKLPTSIPWIKQYTGTSPRISAMKQRKNFLIHIFCKWIPRKSSHAQRRSQCWFHFVSRQIVFIILGKFMISSRGK